MAPVHSTDTHADLSPLELYNSFTLSTNWLVSNYKLVFNFRKLVISVTVTELVT